MKFWTNIILLLLLFVFFWTIILEPDHFDAGSGIILEYPFIIKFLQVSGVTIFIFVTLHWFRIFFGYFLGGRMIHGIFYGILFFVIFGVYWMIEGQHAGFYEMGSFEEYTLFGKLVDTSVVSMFFSVVVYGIGRGVEKIWHFYRHKK